MPLVTKGVAAVATLLAITASAHAADKPITQKTDGKAQVYVCERPTPANHVQHRDHGRLQFVTAQELLADPAPSERPRCITEAELERYAQLHAQRSRELASR